MLNILLLFFSLFVTPALAQGCGVTNPNCIVPTESPATAATTRAANSAFVQAAITAASAGFGNVSGPGSSTVGDAAEWNNTGGTTLKDVTWTTVTQTQLALFSSTQQGVVSASGGGTTNFLRADGNWAAPSFTSGLTYLGTVSVSGGAVSDCPSGCATSILSTNGSSYRSFLFIFKTLLEGTNGATVSFQVHSGGSFQATSYINSAFWSSLGGSVGAGSSPTPAGFYIAPFGVTSTSSVGVSGEMHISNISGASLAKPVWGQIVEQDSTTPGVATLIVGGFWNGAGAVDGFQLALSTGTWSSGSVDIYGIL